MPNKAFSYGTALKELQKTFVLLAVIFCSGLFVQVSFGQTAGGGGNNEPAITKKMVAKPLTTASGSRPTQRKLSNKTRAVKTGTAAKSTIISAPVSSADKAINSGVLNGKAIKLGQPEYPAAAHAVGATGSVNVEVVIDEEGNVISSQAVSGHPLLKAAAEKAALDSKFSPTLVSGQKIRVKGVIIYNFSK